MERISRTIFDSAEKGPIEGFGLTIGEIQAVARRQLAGSVVVAILVLSVAAVIALRSNQLSEPTYTTAHSGVQQPVFVTPSDHIIAAAKRKIEAP